MPTTPGLAACIALLAAALGCQAQVRLPDAAASASARADATPRRVVIEDDGARIEETRLRGVAQRITVQSKVRGAKPYEILVAPAGRDPLQERGAAGQSAWSLFTF
jgi:hypothetical protein